MLFNFDFKAYKVSFWKKILSILMCSDAIDSAEVELIFRKFYITAELRVLE